MKKLILTMLIITLSVPMLGCRTVENARSEGISDSSLKIGFSIKEMLEEFENIDWNLTIEDVAEDAKNTRDTKITNAEIETTVKVDDCEFNKKYYFLNAKKLDGFTYVFSADVDSKDKYTDLYNKIKEEMENRYGEFVYDVYDESSEQPGVSSSKCFSKTDYGFVSAEITDKTLENSDFGSYINIIFYSKDSTNGNRLYDTFSNSK